MQLDHVHIQVFDCNTLNTIYFNSNLFFSTPNILENKIEEYIGVQQPLILKRLNSLNILTFPLYIQEINFSSLAITFLGSDIFLELRTKNIFHPNLPSLLLEYLQETNQLSDGIIAYKNSLSLGLKGVLDQFHGLQGEIFDPIGITPSFYIEEIKEICLENLNNKWPPKFPVTFD